MVTGSVNRNFFIVCVLHACYKHSFSADRLQKTYRTVNKNRSRTFLHKTDAKFETKD